MVDVIESLRRHVGHTSFRPGQEALVRAVLDGRDVLAVMPTGSGASLPPYPRWSGAMTRYPASASARI